MLINQYAKVSEMDHENCHEQIDSKTSMTTTAWLQHYCAQSSGLVLKQSFKYIDKYYRMSAQWCSGTNPAYYAGGTKFKSHHKRYSFASVA